MKTNWAKALPASALAFTLCLAAGCSSDSDSDCEIKASVDAVVTSADQLVAVAADMRGKLYVACSNIAGMDGAKASDATDEKVQTACDAAKAKLDATITGSVSLTYVPGKCEVDAQAQLDCEAKCKSDVMCTEPSIEARCEGGKVSVECSGECTGTVTCEGSATVAAKCEGTCNGSCTGTCSGTCNGKCDGTCSAMDTEGNCAGTCDGTCTGSCSASCEGTCKGSCTFDADASVKCDAKARCEGMCSVMGTAPRCDGEIKPPMCSGNASCQGSCQGSAHFEAKCTPPTVNVVGLADATFATTLRDNMPDIIAVFELAPRVKDGAELLASSTANFVNDLGADIKCGVSKVGTVTAKLQAAAEASLSVSASVNVSATVSGSATAG
jgi:hypothetical protein